MIHNLVHPDRCSHDSIVREPADYSVGIMAAGIWCEDCEADLSDDPRFDDPEPWDDGDRAYDAWKDEREYDR